MSDKLLTALKVAHGPKQTHIRSASPKMLWFRRGHLMVAPAANVTPRNLPIHPAGGRSPVTNGQSRQERPLPSPSKEIAVRETLAVFRGLGRRWGKSPKGRSHRCPVQGPKERLRVMDAMERRRGKHLGPQRRLDGPLVARQHWR